MSKSITKRIVLFEPDEELLKKALVGRDVSVELLEFLKNLLKIKKWPRKINIPSDHDDVAAALVFTTKLKEAGLEIFSELHVFFGGKTIIEKWIVVGEKERISSLPKEAFSAIDIEKVRVQGDQVNVDFRVPISGGYSEGLTKTFDFSVEGPQVRIVPHPLLEEVCMHGPDSVGVESGRTD